jgi:hypothetical protein
MDHQDTFARWLDFATPAISFRFVAAAVSMERLSPREMRSKNGRTSLKRAGWSRYPAARIVLAALRDREYKTLTCCAEA